MSDEATGIRLAGRLEDLTIAGKLKWMDGGQIGPWGTWPGQVFKVFVDDCTFGQIAEIPVPNSTIVSYYLGIAEGKPEIFEVSAQGRKDEILGIFAEGYPAEPTEEKLQLLHALQKLYKAARESAKGTRLKVEQFEQLLERLA